MLLILHRLDPPQDPLGIPLSDGEGEHFPCIGISGAQLLNREDCVGVIPCPPVRAILPGLYRPVYTCQSSSRGKETPQHERTSAASISPFGARIAKKAKETAKGEVL